MSKISEVLEQLRAALEAVIAEIDHKHTPPLDDDELTPPKRKAGLLPDRLVAARYDVSVRTLERWDEEPELGFPPPVYIRRRRYREIEKLDAWDRANARKAADPFSPQRAVAQALPRARAGRFTKPRDIEVR